MREHRPRPTRRPPAERGSAFVLALMTLVILASVGLSLSLITQTEMQIGGSERTLQRVFYAANAGLATSVARALVARDYAAKVWEVEDPDAPDLLDVRFEVDSSPFFLISDGPCNLCAINREDTIENPAYRRLTNAVTVVSRRVGGDGGTRWADKTLSTMVEVQPWQPDPELLLPADDPEQLKKIRF